MGVSIVAERALMGLGHLPDFRYRRVPRNRRDRSRDESVLPERTAECVRGGNRGLLEPPRAGRCPGVRSRAPAQFGHVTRFGHGSSQPSLGAEGSVMTHEGSHPLRNHGHGRHSPLLRGFTPLLRRDSDRNSYRPSDCRWTQVGCRGSRCRPQRSPLSPKIAAQPPGHPQRRCGRVQLSTGPDHRSRRADMTAPGDPSTTWSPPPPSPETLGGNESGRRRQIPARGRRCARRGRRPPDPDRAGRITATATADR